ncbi:hypothetical protein M413DRAFT_440998 [Hebeloma cylindrosporum]|uniref:Uncharacterized protein n=1 Tax=Hebeloma cylindrosporum TaxID=76867 RepID=A0A0C2YY75_HEBCY|nr:hypothetical protein M413DRAFT_440998 [Hebeloma cylindrosporum h7]
MSTFDQPNELALVNYEDDASACTEERVLAIELKMQTVMDEDVRRSAELQRNKAESDARLLALEARVSQIQSHVLHLQHIQDTIMSSDSSAVPSVPQRKHKA